MGYFISVKEAAEYLGVDVGLVRSMVTRGWLPGEKTDRVWRIPAESVEYFYASVGPRAPWKSDPKGEMVLAHNHRCPVCAGDFQSSPKGTSSSGEEFIECRDCRLSLHESLLNHQVGLSEHVAEHGKSLQKMESEGMRARSLLSRRKSALAKVEKLLNEV